MHGRPRKTAKAEDLVASAAKAEKLRQLQSQLLRNHNDRIYNKEALEICSKLLEVNPEVYTAWNYRKLAVQSNLESCGDHEVVQSIVNQELKIAEIALRRNPKCYGAWQHRKWILNLGSDKADFDQEFRLLDQLLKADSRNFHGWNHRRFVVALKNVKEEEELNFTTEKINTNFSNYSAWHNRSVILSHLMKQNAPGFDPREKVLTEELEFIHQALFTDPDDQSGWFYHLWLLDQIIARDSPFLISSWPAHGTEVILSSNTSVKDFQHFESTEYAQYIRALPIVLYFNQAVKGVNSTTVTVESIFTENVDLIWKPLSASNSVEAHCWVTYLNISERDCNSLEPYSINVSFGNTQGLVSSDGCPLSYACQCEFSLKISPYSPGSCSKESNVNMVHWDNENFSRSEFLQIRPFLMSYQRQKIIANSELLISEWCSETLSREIMLFRKLISEINCKIAKLTLGRLLIARNFILSRGIQLTKNRTHFEETLQLYDDLIRLDPSHIGYYKDQRSLVLMDQVTSDEESLRKHCWLPKELSLTSAGQSVCLRLNKLSLTRIGFVERLLWVNMLDLSHNELQSVEGLEAMQLLSHLNLSHNKLSSMTALEPLRPMISLQALDISYNEIGAHSIDTKRYQCASSPLSHPAGTCGDVQGFEDFDPEEVKLYWDAILIFKHLHLTQLDVVGNPILNEPFSSLMIRLVPSLQWLDGRPAQQS
ncbi:unnamed protein product [Spirodela intermedia]|uniref:Geranylgeranyl transferase type-2 subunit alpha n=1 Tax=Spirodela intermedia TaxID=51605 RepID=A0A7I8LMK6_SPIIN|nr:unnamed protein product [Spirodela intermedia]